MSRSASKASYDPYALGIESRSAACFALLRSREAIAMTSQFVPACIAGMTFSTAILATPSTPHLTLSFIQTDLLRQRISQQLLRFEQRSEFEEARLMRITVIGRTLNQPGVASGVVMVRSEVTR